MLGAQARAAELQAAKSAAMRQKAHQEAGEQSIPPKPTPISLTDFARTPLQSKNKGMKAFRPLSDSDFDGPDSQMESISVSPNPRTSSLSTPLNETLQLMIPEPTPTAPRAMLLQAGSTSSKPTPQHHSRALGSSYGGSLQEGREGPGRYDGSIAASPFVATHDQSAISVFGPDDLSPMKQEVKFAEMRRQLGQVPSFPTPARSYRALFTPDAKIFTPQNAYPSEIQFPFQESHTQAPFDSYLYGRPQLSHHQSETGTSSTGHFLNHAQLERTQTFANDIFHHQTKLQQQLRVRSPPNPPQPLLENDQPYDRNSKMQSFVAAQQAMARKGKTVLHNPDLHKSSPLRGHSTPASKQSTLMTPSPLRNQSNTSVSHASRIVNSPRIARQPTGRDSPIRGTVSRGSGARNEPRIPLTDLSNHHGGKGTDLLVSEQFRSEDWCTLRPINSEERERLKQKVKDIAAEMTICGNRISLTNSTNVVGPAAKEWIRSRLSYQTRRHAAVESIVQGFQRQVNVSSIYGVIGRPISRGKVADHCGSLRAAAHIMAALHDLAEEGGNGKGSTKYTDVPEYVIDGKVAVEPFRASLFDDIAVVAGQL